MELVEAQRQQRRASHIPYRDSRLTFLLQVNLYPEALAPLYAAAAEAMNLQQSTQLKHVHAQLEEPLLELVRHEK
jgi:hypothetical protein